MTLETQINLMTVPQEFCRLCNAALQADHGDDFVPIDDDRADGGNDGYLKSQRRMFAMHCFKRVQNQSLDAAIKRKAVGDLGKAIALKQAGLWDVKAWTFISNYQMPEAIGRELLSMGHAVEIDVSWRNASHLADALQRHSHLRPAFPALQANELVEKIDEIRVGIQDGTPIISCSNFGVPRTQEQIDLVRKERPDYWEHRLFAGLLDVGLKERAFAWRDFELGISDRTPSELSETEFLSYLSTFFSRLTEVTGPMMRPFDADAQRRAFGAPGESGDAGAIEHFALRILNLLLVPWVV